MASLGQSFNKLLSQSGASLAPTGGSAAHYNWLIILFVLFVVFLVGFTMGRTRMLLALVAIYAAAFLEAHFIYFSQLQSYFKIVPAYWLHVGLLVIIYIIIFGILNRSILKGRLAVKEASVIAIMLEAILIVGFFTSLVLSLLPTDQVKVLPASILYYFTNKNAQFIWAVGPLLTALLLRGKAKES